MKKVLIITTDFHISRDHENALIRMFDVKGLDLSVAKCEDKHMEAIVTTIKDTDRITAHDCDLIGITLQIASKLNGLEEMELRNYDTSLE